MLLFLKKNVFLSLKINFGFIANSADPDEMLGLFMRGSRMFCHRGSNFDKGFFLVDEGREDQNTTISGLSLTRQRNTILMVFRWHADNDPTLNAGLEVL